MATTWYAQNSSVNIDSANEWNTAADGSGSYLTWPPASDDTLRANGKTAIAINVDFTCAQIDTLTSGGGFTVANARTITTNIQAGTTTCVTVTGDSYTVIINGDIYGGGSTSAYGLYITSGSASIEANDSYGGSGISSYGIRNSGTGSVDVNSSSGGTNTSAYGIGSLSTGSVTANTATGGTGSSAFGIAMSGAGIVTLGTATGGSGSGAHGLNCTSLCVPTVTNAVGGSNVDTYGVNHNTTTTLSVTNITGGSNASAYGVNMPVVGTVSITGTSTAGSVTGCSAVRSVGAGLVVISGNIIDNEYASAICARVIQLNQSSTNYHRVYTGSGTRDMYYDIPDAANVRETDTVAGVTGTVLTKTLSAANDTVAAGYYADTTLSTVDANLASANIVSGKTIFGFAGSASGGGGGIQVLVGGVWKTVAAAFVMVSGAWKSLSS